MPKSGFLAEARARGFVFQCTDEEALDAALLEGRVAAYAGFDLTADSLHVGHMIPIMLLRLFQKHGHKPVAVVGGGTSMIGDPSFREEARQLLSDAQLAVNLAGIRRNIERFLQFGAGVDDAVLVNNADWLGKIGFIEFLREVGPHFSISRMLSFDSVRTRLEREQGLTFFEFTYSLLQSYDFLELNRQHNVTLQFGGSDQWGNIVSGVDLIRRVEGKTVFGLTTPLITTASGAKMGKSAAGAVWLSAEKLSPFHYWQFWRNTEDGDVGRFLRLFTDVDLKEIEDMERWKGAEINVAKEVLATQATALAHGWEAAEKALETARKTFSEGLAAEGLPTVEVKLAELEAGIPAFALFVKAGLAASNGEARRLIRGGGAYMRDIVIDKEGHVIDAHDLSDGVIKLSAGKKNHVLVKAVG